MKAASLALVMMLFIAPASAKDQLIPLSEADSAQLNGKTVAITLHDRPSFVAMTAGKAGFGLFGAGAMISAGNKLVEQNQIADPAILLRDQLSIALTNAYGIVPLPLDTTPTKATKPKDLAKLHPEADYILDIRSAGWNHAYYPTQWATYWVGYSAQVQLIDTKTGRQVSNAACNANTNKHPNSPSRDALLANNAQLLKDVTINLGWTCVQLLAKEQFNIPAENIPAIPASHENPLAAYAAQGAQPPALIEEAAPAEPTATSQQP
ncbi:MAG: hypothetical protein IAE66_02060 [Xanthomonadaceae bacterium]|nr:hypothetical protein [Xanthomonadaceae bacterium]